jgi:hypothetical protein
MAVIIDTPHPTLPPTHVPPGGVPYRIKNGDNWISLAQQLGMEPKSLIFFNYGTTEPKYVNYYLKHNVGCKVVSPDGKNYSFTDAHPGVIYVPSDRSNFHYINEPTNPVVAFHVPAAGSLFELIDHPQHPGVMGLLKANFAVSVLFNKKLADVTPFVYRQYIKGRFRVRTSASSAWHDITPIEVPGHLPGTDWSVGTLMPIKRHTWMEDGKMANGKVLRYGYREAPPFLLQKAEADYYRDPITKTPPQAGFEYICMDQPSAGWEYRHTASDGTHHTVNAVSAELYFRGEVVEWRGVRIVRTLRTAFWDYQGHFAITSRPPLNPLAFHAIPKPA